MNHLKITILFLLGISFPSSSWAQKGWFTYRAWYGERLGYNYVSTIAIDLENNKYFGHYGLHASYDGIDYVSVYSHKYEWSKLYTGVNSGGTIAVDKNNVVWISEREYWRSGLYSMIWYYKDKKLNLYHLSDDVPKLGPVDLIVVDNKNNKWIVASSAYENHGGLVKYNDIEKTVFYINWGIRTLVIDNYDNLWGVTSNKNFMFFNGKEFSQYIVLEGFPIYEPSFIITVDYNNNIWIGIYKIIYYDEASGNKEEILNGIACFDGITWKLFNIENSGIVSNNIYSIAVDRNNVKWFGTDAGVSRFDGETWSTFNTYNSGLCDNKVNAIAVEKNNTIWFGTDNGVSEYSSEIIPVSVEEETIPYEIPVLKTYPNPFNPSTTIEFTLPEAVFTTLTIYNMAGQKVRQLVSERMTAGTHRLRWDGRDNSGNPVSAGIYIARLKAGDMTVTGKLVLVK